MSLYLINVRFINNSLTPSIMKRALFLGRFQPFHKGHLVDVEKASNENDKVVIVIGSSQYSNTIDNPFSVRERGEMINRTLKANNISNYKITAVDDINNDDEYVEHVDKFVPEYESVYTHNNLTKKLFGEKNYKIVWVDLINDISATKIRDRIINNKNWKELLPKEVVNYLEEIKGVERIKEIN